MYIDEPMSGKDANSPSITNELRNESLERKKSVTDKYDMFADDDEYQHTNVSKKDVELNRLSLRIVR